MNDADDIVVGVPCELHGTPHPVTGRRRVALPVDAVYLTKRPTASGPDAPRVWCAFTLCEGGAPDECHAIALAVTEEERAELEGIGVKEIDDPTRLLLLRLASADDFGLADRALAEVEDRSALLDEYVVAWGRAARRIRPQDFESVRKLGRQRLDFTGRVAGRRRAR